MITFRQFLEMCPSMTLELNGHGGDRKKFMKMAGDVSVCNPAVAVDSYPSGPLAPTGSNPAARFKPKKPGMIVPQKRRLKKK